MGYNIFLNGCLFQYRFQNLSSTITKEETILILIATLASRIRFYTIHCMTREVVGLFLITTLFYRLCVWHGWGAFFPLFKYGRQALFAQSVCVTTLSPNYPQELFEASCLIFLLQ